MAIGFLRKTTPLQFRPKIAFYFEQSFVYTITEKQYNKMNPLPEDFSEDAERPDGSNGYLGIECTFDLEEFDRISNGAAICRPRTLVLLGFICFLTGRAIIPANFDNISFNAAKEHLTDPNIQTVCVVERRYRLTKDLQALLNFFTGVGKAEKIIIFSLLDRWRKAVYLEEENQEGLSTSDEAILACFHIWEVLGGLYSDSLEKSIKTKYADTVKSIFTDDLYL